jgi:GDP-mannose transporter
MVEDKKTDDYTVEMDKLDKGGNKEFEAAPPPLTRAASSPPSSLSNHPALPVLAYCGSSILMTVMNKYVLSGLDFNLNFLLLMIQVCALISIGVQ